MYFAKGSGVNPPLPSPWRILFLAAVLAVFPFRSALALSVATVTRPDTDSLLVQFGQAGQYPIITRTGPKELTLRFPPGSLKDEKPPEKVDFASSRLVEDLRLAGDTVVVRLRTDGFGFVGWPDGERALKVQVYRDPAGANWHPSGASTTSPPAGPPPSEPASSVKLPVTPPNNAPGPLHLPPLPAALTAGTPGKTAASSPAKEPFFAVQHSLRAPALRVPPEKSPVLRQGGLERPVAEPGPQPVAAAGRPAPAAGGEYRVKLPPIPATVTAAADSGGVRSAVTPPGPGPQPAPIAAEETAAGTASAPAASPPASADKKQPAPPASEQQTEDANFLVGAQAEKLAGNLEGARNMLESLKAKPSLAKDLREEVLYSLAAVYADLFKDEPAAHYDKIRGAYEEAINANTDSYRIPEALLQLGMLNLRVGNLPEAKGYFSVLTKKYPTDANVPLVNFYWGEHYYDHGDFKKAAESYQTLIEKYPESKYVREGAMGLAKAMVRLGKYKEAAEIADYIDKRWPRYYIDFPAILRIEGDIAYRTGDIKKAKDQYLAYYNLEPKVKDMDMVLARLGDIYARLGNKPAAVDFYNMAVKEGPDSEGGLIAKMRLAEQGVHDQPSINEMFSLFGKPAQGSPEEIYTSIVRDHPDSPLAPLAQIKLAMWLLFRQNYPDSIKAASRFLELYPKSDLAPRATDVAVAAFEKLAKDRIANKDYARLVEAWRANPILAANRDRLSKATRMGLAMAYYRTDQFQDALTEVLPFIGPRETADGNMALAMAAGIYRSRHDWKAIVDLARQVQGWKFGPTMRRDLEFTVAQALENLGHADRAKQIWFRLAGDQALESGKRCFAMYYMAKEAMAKKELEKAELYAGEAAAMFRETDQDPDKLKGSVNILVEAAKGLGQYPQALQGADAYAALCREGDDDWSANRLRIAALQRAMGDMAGWRKTLTSMRDAAPDSLYGKMAASDLTANGLQDRLDALTQPR